jgi:hypothetical protein
MESLQLRDQVWYVKNKGGLDLTSISELIVKWANGRLNEMSEQDYLGHQAFQQLEEEKLRIQDPLVSEFRRTEGVT